MNTSHDQIRYRVLIGSLLAFALATAGEAGAQKTTMPAPEDETTTCVSVDSAGIQGNGDSELWSGQTMSVDGRYVVVLSYADNLVPGDTNNRADVFVHDRLTGETTRVSVSSTGKQADYFNGPSCISTDGRYIAFTSRATN